MTRDPLGYVDGPNVYGYVKGRTTGRTDRLGLLTDCDVDLISLGEADPPNKPGDLAHDGIQLIEDFINQVEETSWGIALCAVGGVMFPPAPGPKEVGGKSLSEYLKHRDGILKGLCEVKRLKDLLKRTPQKKRKKAIEAIEEAEAIV